MNLQKCKNGHYYDQDKFVKCPYCAAKKMPLKDTLVLDGSEDAHTRKEGSSLQLKDAVATAMKMKQYQESVMSITREPVIGEEHVLFSANGMLEDDRRLPVGVLVAIEGTCKGAIYRLQNGYNYLIVEQQMIYLQYEPDAEHQPQAAIYYDVGQNLFVLKLMDENADIRIGKMQLEDSVRLVLYDTILIGEDIFLFVPICGDQFQWG